MKKFSINNKKTNIKVLNSLKKMGPQSSEQTKKPQPKISTQIEKKSKPLTAITSKNSSIERKSLISEINIITTIMKNGKNCNQKGLNEKSRLFMTNDNKKLIHSKISDDTRNTGDNSLLNSKVSWSKNEICKLSIKKVGLNDNSRIKNTLSYCNQILEKENNYRNKIDFNTLNIVNYQSTDKDSSINKFKSIIDEKDDIIQKLTNKIEGLETRIKSFEESYLDKATSSTRISKDFKINLGKQNNFMSNKKILFNVEVNQNLNEKSLVNKKLLSSKVNTSLSTLSNPISPMNLQNPHASLICPIKNKTNIYFNENILIENTVSKKKTSDSLMFKKKLNSIRDKTKSVLDKYQQNNVILMCRIRSMSSHNTVLEKEKLEKI